MAQSDQFLKQLMAKWEYLAPDQKGHYNMKLSTLKERHGKLLSDARKFLVRLEDDTDRAKINLNAYKGVSCYS